MRTKQAQNLDIDPAIYNRVRPFIALDLEVASPFPNEGEWWESDLLGISCVGLYSFPHNASVTYMPETVGGEPVGPMMGRMSAGAVEDMVETLWSFHTRDDMDLVTWNGAGFDWRCIWLECASPNARKLVKRMACEHQDPAYQMLCERGFMVGLEKAADATCGVRKTEGVSGKLAPQMWASGDLAEQERVLTYVAQDALITAQLYAAVCQDGLLKWLTSRGTIGEWMPKRFNHGKRFRTMSVSECSKFPLPDTSWLTEPWPREKFVNWLQD